MMSAQHSGGQSSSSDAAAAGASTMQSLPSTSNAMQSLPSTSNPMQSMPSTSNAPMYSGAGGGGQQSFDYKNGAETTPQFKPRSHYAQPYYQSTGNGNVQPQQQPSAGGGNARNSIGPGYAPRNSLTPDARQNSLGDHHLQHGQQHQQFGYGQNNVQYSPPPVPPSRTMNNAAAANDDQLYPGGAGIPQQQSSGYGAGGRRRSYGQNGPGGGMPGPRQSLVDRHWNDGSGGGGGLQSRDSRMVHRPGGHPQYDDGSDFNTDSSALGRNNKYVNRESLHSFQQVTCSGRDRPSSEGSSRKIGTSCSCCVAV